MAADGKILEQDDIDALLAEAEDFEESEESKETTEEPEKKRFKASPKRSDEEVKAMSFQLYNKAFIKRDEGTQVIWNAKGIFPMEKGVNLNIRGKSYVSVGVLNENHLVVGTNPLE